MSIYIVTHGEKYEGGNPGMTPKGFKQIESLKKYLPKKPVNIICGTGKRFLDIAKALGLDPTSYNGVVGTPASLNKNNTVSLADGTVIPREIFATSTYMREVMPEFIRSLPPNSIILSGRAALLRMNYQGDIKSAAIYKVDCMGIKITINELITYSEDAGGREKEV